MTDVEEVVDDVQTVVVEEKKEIQNEIHPSVKSLWEELKLDVAEFEVWIKAEIAKL